MSFHQSESLSINKLHHWVNFSNISIISNLLIDTNNIKADIVKGKRETKTILSCISSTIKHFNLDIQTLDRTRNSTLANSTCISHNLNLATVLHNNYDKLIQNISNYITNCKVGHDKQS